MLTWLVRTPPYLSARDHDMLLLRPPRRRLLRRARAAHRADVLRGRDRAERPLLLPHLLVHPPRARRRMRRGGRPAEPRRPQRPEHRRGGDAAVHALRGSVRDAARAGQPGRDSVPVAVRDVHGTCLSLLATWQDVLCSVKVMSRLWYGELMRVVFSVPLAADDHAAGSVGAWMEERQATVWAVWVGVGGW